jgi:hypothetical protein
MSSALALVPGFETRWTVVSGAMKGSVRTMNAAQFTIGRSNECELVILNDPKCSRKHVTIVLLSDGCEVIALSEKNPIWINGEEVHKGRLREGDVLTIGDTELKFSMAGAVQLEVPRGPQMPQMMPQHYPPQAYGAHPQAYGGPRPTRPAPKPQGNSKRLYIYGAVVLIGLWLFMSDNAKKKEEKKLRTEQNIQTDIETAQKLREASEAANMKRLDGTINMTRAQENYVRGFRDYRDGQYERALISFQACLALNPEHTLCNRYLRLAQRKFNEVVQYHMVLGRTYRDQSQFKSCRAAFRNVMVMVKDASSLTYKEAKANYEACNSFVEGRF